jgi:D-alanine-D-alanine ligase
VFGFITSRRDAMERSLRQWVDMTSRTDDTIGLEHASRRAAELFGGLGMRAVEDLSDGRAVSVWETAAGLADGMLFVANLDVPVQGGFPAQTLRREREWLHGEGVGSSRAPLVMLEFACRALRSIRRLRQLPIGVLCYSDEGHDGRFSAETVQAAMARAREVFVLRPASSAHGIVTGRRGQRRYRLRVEGRSLGFGAFPKRPDPLRWTWAKLEQIAALGSKAKRLSAATIDVRVEHLPMRLPHRITATLVMTYPLPDLAESTERGMRDILGRGGPRWELEVLTNRPPFVERPAGLALADELSAIGTMLELPLTKGTSAWPSVAGLAGADQACVCGIGPEAHDLRTPQEAVQRTSFIQRTLLLAQFLAGRLPTRDGDRSA